MGPLDTCPVRISWGAAEVRFPLTAASRSPPGGNGFLRAPQGSLNPAAALSGLGAAVELGVWVAAKPPGARTPCTPCKRILRDGEGRKLSPKTLESESCDSSPSAARSWLPREPGSVRRSQGLAADPAPPPRLPPLNPSLNLGEERGFLPSSPTRAVAVPSLLWVSYTSLRGHFFQDPFLFLP